MFLIDRRYLKYFDWISFGLTFLLATIGLLFVFSATYKPDVPYSIFFKKQAFGLVSGFVLYLFFCLIDYRALLRWGYFLYFGVLALLAFTIVKGSIGMGAQRWINLGIFKFQPAELAKLFAPAFFTFYIKTHNKTHNYTFLDFLPVIIILLLSAFLVLKQPDLGTALLLLFSSLIMLWLANINKKFFIYFFLAVAVSAPVTWRFLKTYQKKRIAVFLGAGEQKNERYQIEQSKIAIGSGGLWGKGFLQGTQNKLMFLPESRTDFIFSVIAEELGFVGAVSVLLLLLFLFARIFSITMRMQFLPRLLAIGLLIHIVLSALINIGMVIGLLPIVGIPLPLISYGLSNLWVTLASLGWINGIRIREALLGDYVS